MVRTIVPNDLYQSVEAKTPSLLSAASLYTFLSSILRHLFECSLAFSPTWFIEVTQESKVAKLSETIKS